MKGRLVLVLVLVPVAYCLCGLGCNAAISGLIADENRIARLYTWIINQERSIHSGLTAYVEAMQSDDAQVAYVDKNAMTSLVLTLLHEQNLQKQLGVVFMNKPQDQIKIGLNFILESRTGSDRKDFRYRYDLRSRRWSESTTGDLNWWNSHVIGPMALTLLKMRFSPTINTSPSEYSYYDGLKNAIIECLETWRLKAYNEVEGCWTFSLGDGKLGKQITENGMMLSALVAISKYELMLGNESSALKYAQYAQRTARWLMNRQERNPDRSWPQGGGYGGLYESTDTDSQYSSSNGRAISSLAVYGQNIVDIVPSANPSYSEVSDVMKKWAEGFAQRTHDPSWGPLFGASPMGALRYPVNTYAAAAMGTGLLGAFDFTNNNDYYDWATRIYRWALPLQVATNHPGARLQDRFDLWNLRYGFLVGYDNNARLIMDSNLETNTEMLLFMLSLNDSFLAFKLPKRPSASRTQQCAVAAAVGLSRLSDTVESLRAFRNTVVLSTYAGRSFMTAFNSWYYSFSPYLAKSIADSEYLKDTAFSLLKPLIHILASSKELSSNLAASSEFTVLTCGLIASSLVGTVYLCPTICFFEILCKARTRRTHSHGAFD